MWEPGLGIVTGNLACEPVPGKFDWKSCSWGGWRPQAFAVGEKGSQPSSQEEAPKQVSRKRFPSKVKFFGTACKYGSQKRFPSKVQGTVSKQGSKQEQGSQEQVLKQAFPGRAVPKQNFQNNWEPLLANLFLGTLLENLFSNLAWEAVPGNLAWEPFPGNIAWELFPGTLLVNLFLGNLYGQLFLGTCGWEPLPENLAWEPACWELGSNSNKI